MDNKKITINITYGEMRKLVKAYYAEQGKDVSLRINNEIDNDRFAGSVVTNMFLQEAIQLSGIKKITSTEININDLKNILRVLLEKQGKELVSLINNAMVDSNVEGYLMGEHTVEFITDKSFTCVVRDKKFTRTRNK